MKQAMEKLQEPVNPFLFLLVLVIITGFFHSTTLSHSPGIWNDEVQILDYGRVLFDLDANWSLTVDNEGKAGLLLTPVYSAIAYVWGNALGFSPLSIRLLSLISAVSAVLLFAQLLRKLNVPPWVAVLAALALWVDPLFVKSFRGARADPFSIAVALAGALLFSKSLEKQSMYLAVGSGALLVVATLSWPTAVVVLVFYVYAYAVSVHWNNKYYLRELAAVSIGATTILVVYLLAYYIPNAERISRTLADSYYIVDNSVAKVTNVFLRAYSQAPWTIAIFLVGIMCALWSKRGGLSLILLIIGGYVTIYAPSFHVFRFVYLLPILYTFVALSVTGVKYGKFIFVLGLLVPSMLLNPFMRVAVGLIEGDRRNYDHVAIELNDLIPKQSTVITHGDTVHYYQGLNNDWKMFAVNSSVVTGDINEFYLVITRNTSEFPKWADKKSCEYLRAIKSPEITRIISGRKFHLYFLDVYRCKGGGL